MAAPPVTICAGRQELWISQLAISQKLSRSGMTSDAPSPFDPSRLRLASDLRRRGDDPVAKDDKGRRLWTRVRHGVVIASATWFTLSPEQRHAALVHATALRMLGSSTTVFSHTSAAAVWGLPRVTAWPTHVEVTSTARRVRSSGRIRRHALPLTGVDEQAGLPVTSLSRTLIDLGRTGDLADAVAATDFALHHAMCTRTDLINELASLDPGVPGRARAQLSVDLAHPGGTSVGESLSRVQMFRSNIPKPQLQVRVEDEDGLAGICDFGWEEQGVVGEFDGRKKYRVGDGVAKEEVEQVLWREKQREDRIRARGRRVARWVWSDALRPTQMLAILSRQGVRQVARSDWFDDEVAARHPRRPDAA